jgi:hypothetical protein
MIGHEVMKQNRIIRAAKQIQEAFLHCSLGSGCQLSIRRLALDGILSFEFELETCCVECSIVRPGILSQHQF